MASENQVRPLRVPAPSFDVASAHRPLKILSLTGGGYRGLFAAEVLVELCDRAPRPGRLYDSFDVFGGTSIGGLMACALVVGVPPRRVPDAIDAHGPLVFVKIVWARISGKGADESILEALAAIERGEPSGFLIVEAGDLGGSAEIVKKFGAATHASVIAFYEETDAERAVYAKALAKELGIAFDRDAEDYFLTALPADRGLARQEIEKLALYAYDLGRNVSVEDLEALMAAEADSALDAASLAAAQGKAAHAVESLARIDAHSGGSALRALLRRLHQLRDARILIDGGMSSDEAIAKLRPPVFWKERDAVAAQARLWTSKKLNAAYDVLWTAEMRSKTAGAPQSLSRSTARNLGLVLIAL